MPWILWNLYISNVCLHDPTFCCETQCDQLPLHRLGDQLPSEVQSLETPEATLWKHHYESAMWERCCRRAIEGHCRRSAVAKKPAYCGLFCWCICIYVHLGAYICIVSMCMYMCACACAILFMHVHIRTCKSVLEFVCGPDVCTWSDNLHCYLLQTTRCCIQAQTKCPLWHHWKTIWMRWQESDLL